MHPDLEFFLEDAFDQIQSTIPGVGRVVIEPDYDAEPEASDKEKLSAELINVVQGHKAPDEFGVPPGFEVLAKYVRRIKLRKDVVGGPWVEVAPPGNWI
jgi:hypothetical protein